MATNRETQDKWQIKHLGFGTRWIFAPLPVRTTFPHSMVVATPTGVRVMEGRSPTPKSALAKRT